MAKASVLGLGNVLMGDDGVGPHVVRVLDATYEMPENVSILDVGTPGLDLIPFLSGADRLVIVDSVRASGRPGQVRLFGREELLNPLARPRLGPHDPGLVEALSLLELAGERRSGLLLVGVIPERIETGVGLSPAVSAAVPVVVEIVVGELAARGLPPTKRARPRSPDLWWETRAPRGAPPGEPACTR